MRQNFNHTDVAMRVQKMLMGRLWVRVSSSMRTRTPSRWELSLAERRSTNSFVNRGNSRTASWIVSVSWSERIWTAAALRENGWTDFLRGRWRITALLKAGLRDTIRMEFLMASSGSLEQGEKSKLEQNEITTMSFQDQLEKPSPPLWPLLQRSAEGVVVVRTLWWQWVDSWKGEALKHQFDDLQLKSWIWMHQKTYLKLLTYQDPRPMNFRATIWCFLMDNLLRSTLCVICVQFTTPSLFVCQHRFCNTYHLHQLLRWTKRESWQEMTLLTSFPTWRWQWRWEN